MEKFELRVVFRSECVSVVPELDVANAELLGASALGFLVVCVFANSEEVVEGNEVEVCDSLGFFVLELCRVDEELDDNDWDCKFWSGGFVTALEALENAFKRL